MKKLIAIGIFSLITGLFFGCGGYSWVEPQVIQQYDEIDETTAYVCISVQQEQFQAVSEAVIDWDKSLRQWRRFVPIHDENVEGGCTYWVKEVEYPNPKDPDALAWASTVGGKTVYLLKGSYEFATKQIMLHELGHAFGAQHVNGTLMNPTVGEEMMSCPDVTTVAQIAAWNNLDLTLLGWCEKK